jgi:hypothetical protein
LTSLSSDLPLSDSSHGTESTSTSDASRSRDSPILSPSTSLRVSSPDTTEPPSVSRSLVIFSSSSSEPSGGGIQGGPFGVGAIIGIVVGILLLVVAIVALRFVLPQNESYSIAISDGPSTEMESLALSSVGLFTTEIAIDGDNPLTLAFGEVNTFEMTFDEGVADKY